MKDLHVGDLVHHSDGWLYSGIGIVQSVKKATDEGLSTHPYLVFWPLSNGFWFKKSWHPLKELKKIS